MKKLALILCLATVLVALFSCEMTGAPDPSLGTTAEGTADSTERPTTELPTTKKEGKPIDPPAFAEGAAFYSATDAGTVRVTSSYRVIYYDSRTYLNLAEKLSAAYASRGLDLALSDDRLIEGNPNYYLSDCEICVGPVRNRPEYAEVLAPVGTDMAAGKYYGAFFIGAENGKVYITGADADSVSAGVSFYLNQYVSYAKALPSDLRSLYVYSKADYATGKYTFVSPDTLRADTTLDSFTMGGAPLPGFDPSVFEYSFLISQTAALPTMAATAKSPYCTVDVVDPTEQTMAGSVTLTSGDSKHTVTYTFNWSRGDFETVNATLYKLKNGATGAVTFVHDDGNYETAAYLVSKSQEYGLKFDIAFIGQNLGSLAKDAQGKFIVDANGNYCVTVKTDGQTTRWQSLIASNSAYVEVASHSMTHSAWGLDPDNVAAEILGSQQLLRAVFPGQKVETFAYPGFSASNRESEQYPAAKALMPGHYVGARYLSLGKENSLADPDYFYLGACGTYYQDPATWGKGAQNTDGWLMNSLTRARTNGGWVVSMTHVISSADSLPLGNMTVNQIYYDYMLTHYVVPYVQDGTLWNGFFSEVSKYVYEYNHVTMDCNSYPDGHIEVKLNFTADAEYTDIYDYPLTVDVPVDSSWHHVSFSYVDRNGQKVTETVAVQNGVVRLQVVPACPATVVFAD